MFKKTTILFGFFRISGYILHYKVYLGKNTNPAIVGETHKEELTPSGIYDTIIG